MVRQLQILIPTIKIWLDVDELDDVGRLEECVGASMCFAIFLSKNYFKSKSCRRELATALHSGKPMIVVHESDVAKGGATLEEMRLECEEHCQGNLDEGLTAKVCKRPNCTVMCAACAQHLYSTMLLSFAVMSIEGAHSYHVCSR